MPARDHDRSINLNYGANETLDEQLDYNNQVSTSRGIVQLFQSEKPNHKKWTMKCTGVICFIKDYNRRSYFFSLYNQDAVLLWEQEMYTPFSYNKLTSNFYYFAADARNSRSHELEADKFSKEISIRLDRYAERDAKKRDQEKEKALATAVTIEPGLVTAKPKTLNPNKAERKCETKPRGANIFEKFLTLGRSSASKPPLIDKSSISLPTNFQIIQHIGPNSGTGEIEVNLLDDNVVAVEMQSILSQLNLKSNKKTKKFITQFANQYGVEEIKKEIYRKTEAPALPPPPIPKRADLPLKNEVLSFTEAPQKLDKGIDLKTPPPPPIVVETDKPAKILTVALFESIRNFKGGLKHVDTRINQACVLSNVPCTMLSHLKDQLGQLRKFLEDSEDEDNGSDEEWS